MFYKYKKLFMRIRGVYLKLYFHIFSNGKVFLGNRCIIGKDFVINLLGNKPSLKIGDHFITRKGCVIHINGGEISIGNIVFMNNNVSINSMKKIVIGNNVNFGENVKIYDHDHSTSKLLSDRKKKYIKNDIYIGDNVWIGSNCLILKGVSIGENSVIGAGSIITKSVDKNKVVVQKRETFEKSL